MRQAPEFELKENTLCVSGDLRSPVEMRFDIMAQKLLKLTDGLSGHKLSLFMIR